MIYVLGTIGSGKSSLTKILAQDMGVKYYLEDVNNGLISGMLRKFYSAGESSRKQVSGMLQVAFLTVRYEQLRRALTETNSILDSNLISDHIMAKNLYDSGEMDEEVYNVYNTLSQQMQANVNGTPFNGYPDLIIYLDIEPEHEIDAIQKRGRDMEDIRKDQNLVKYYHKVNQAYKDWFKGHQGATVVRIDREKYDFIASLNDRNDVLDLIETELVKLGRLSPEDYKTIQDHRVGLE